MNYRQKTDGLTYEEIHVACNKHDIECCQLTKSELSDEERKQLSIVAVASTGEVEFLLRLIERLTKEKIIPADERQ